MRVERSGAIAARSSSTSILALLAAIFTLLAACSAQAAQDLTQIVENIVMVDARGWAFNKYLPGSMRKVEVIPSGGGIATLYGEYKFASFQKVKSGWVKIRLRNGSVECIEFWDFSGDCRPLGQTQARQFATELEQNFKKGLQEGGTAQSDTPQLPPCRPCEIAGRLDCGTDRWGRRCLF